MSLRPDLYDVYELPRRRGGLKRFVDRHAVWIAFGTSFAIFVGGLQLLGALP